MENCQTEGDDANIDINAAGDVGNSAKAIIESRVVEEPRQNIQSKNQQESTCSLLGSTIEKENVIPGVKSLNLADNPKLMKFGLEPHEVENLLISKVRCFLDEPNIEVIQDIKKQTVLRQNVTGEGKLDKRRSSTKLLLAKGIIPNESDCPSKVKTDTSNKQGVTRFDNDLKKAYHKDQELFLQSVEALQLLDLPTNIKVQGGYLKENGSKITPEKFCEIVDGVTKKFLKKYSSDLVPVENIDSDDMKNAYESCEKVCTKRHLMDMAIQNDLLDKNSYDRWRDHILVYSSFAAFLYVYLEKTWDRVKK
ncbi:uncharacterized protein LOC143059819 isoform X2 [Mytilus galloprovincialis]|uniref:uncharacterized protein LOC143059819 isoform X2 n=1 Tax=Mytilus galloprovincialis TaxID=29158 RepID=UPI003F7C8550